MPGRVEKTLALLVYVWRSVTVHVLPTSLALSSKTGQRRWALRTYRFGEGHLQALLLVDNKLPNTICSERTQDTFCCGMNSCMK